VGKLIRSLRASLAPYAREDIDTKSLAGIHRLHECLPLGHVRMDVPEQKTIRQRRRDRAKGLHHDIHIVEGSHPR